MCDKFVEYHRLCTYLKDYVIILISCSFIRTIISINSFGYFTLQAQVIF